MVSISNLPCSGISSNKSRYCELNTYSGYKWYSSTEISLFSRYQQINSCSKHSNIIRWNYDRSACPFFFLFFVIYQQQEWHFQVLRDSKHVCSSHFKPDDYHSNPWVTAKRLNKGAVPSVFDECDGWEKLNASKNTTKNASHQRQEAAPVIVKTSHKSPHHRGLVMPYNALYLGQHWLR